MSRHAQVEEIFDDSDPDEVAPADDSSADLARGAVLPAAAIPQPGTSSIPMRPAPEPQREIREIPKHYQCLYPVYFDRTRSRAQGRKVGAELAVDNPLARDIVDAVQTLGLRAALEPEKQHPKDWANPGRVRVLLKEKDGTLMSPKIKNSMLRTPIDSAGWLSPLTRLRTSPLSLRRPVPQSPPHNRKISLSTAH